jgi:hypothetical protein
LMIRNGIAEVLYERLRQRQATKGIHPVC